MTGLFVTGTDTGIGKTLVTATLLAWARRRRCVALPVKPVQTGWPAADDVADALRGAGLLLDPALQRQLTPFRYRPAVSPHLAARGRLTAAVLADACRRAAPPAARVVIEGAGGVLVPLNQRETMRDLMRRLRLPVLLVARAGLGTLNHTLLSLAALRAGGLRVLGVILNQRPGELWGRIERDNLRTLADRAGVPVVRFRPVNFPTVGKSLARNFQSLETLAGLAEILTSEPYPVQVGPTAVYA